MIKSLSWLHYYRHEIQSIIEKSEDEDDDEEVENQAVIPKQKQSAKKCEKETAQPVHPGMFNTSFM